MQIPLFFCVFMEDKRKKSKKEKFSPVFLFPFVIESFFYSLYNFKKICRKRITGGLQDVQKENICKKGIENYHCRLW